MNVEDLGGKVEVSAYELARRKGWAVNAGEMRMAGPLDWLAQENNALEEQRREIVRRIAG